MITADDVGGLHLRGPCSQQNAGSRLGCSWPEHQALTALCWQLHQLGCALSHPAAVYKPSSFTRSSCKLAWQMLKGCAAACNLSDFMPSNILMNMLSLHMPCAVDGGPAQRGCWVCTIVLTLVGLRGPCTPSGISAMPSRIFLTCRQSDNQAHAAAAVI